MINLEDLDGIKLVKAEYLVEDVELQMALESAYAQGSQGWGVVKSTALLLTMARDLHAALKIALVADENFRLLKGAQMALGREKKAKDVLQEQLDMTTSELDSAVNRCTALEDELAETEGALAAALVRIEEGNKELDS